VNPAIFRRLNLLFGTFYYLLFCFLLSSARAQQTARTNGPLVGFGEDVKLHSEILKEDRTFSIYVPESYEHSTFAPKQYPVLYLLDGNEWSFRWASQLVQYMADCEQIPELIVVAIPNVNRNRDFTPTLGPGIASSGGGESFEKFLNEEVAAYVDAHFRTAPYRILVGHSFGGVLAMDSFLRKTNGFQAYLALDPSLFWDKGILVQHAMETLSKAKDFHNTVFIATADHPLSFLDKSSLATNSIKLASERFFKILNKCPSPGLRVKYQHFDSEDHGSVRLIGLYDGLRFVFEDYKPQNSSALDTPSLFADNFKKVSNRLGFTMLPPEQYVNEIAYWLLEAHEADRAIACFKLNVTNYPDSGDAYASLAEAYFAKGDRQAAKSNFEKSLQLSPGNTKAAGGLKALGTGGTMQP
jgi:predicted alpha/beta superfamily hydrolase